MKFRIFLREPSKITYDVDDLSYDATVLKGLINGENYAKVIIPINNVNRVERIEE